MILYNYCKIRNQDQSSELEKNMIHGFQHTSEKQVSEKIGITTKHIFIKKSDNTKNIKLLKKKINAITEMLDSDMPRHQVINRSQQKLQEFLKSNKDIKGSHEFDFFAMTKKNEQILGYKNIVNYIILQVLNKLTNNDFENSIYKFTYEYNPFRDNSTQICSNFLLEMIQRRSINYPNDIRNEKDQMMKIINMSSCIGKDLYENKKPPIGIPFTQMAFKNSTLSDEDFIKQVKDLLKTGPSIKNFIQMGSKICQDKNTQIISFDCGFLPLNYIDTDSLICSIPTISLLERNRMCSPKLEIITEYEMNMLASVKHLEPGINIIIYSNKDTKFILFCNTEHDFTKDHPEIKQFLREISGLMTLIKLFKNIVKNVVDEQMVKLQFGNKSHNITDMGFRELIEIHSFKQILHLWKVIRISMGIKLKNIIKKALVDKT